MLRFLLSIVLCPKSSILLTIKRIRKAKMINKELLVALAIFLILLGLAVLDGATAYLDHQSILLVSISMFICTGLNIIAGIGILMARYFYSYKPKAQL
jgi:hypothetical protein